MRRSRIRAHTWHRRLAPLREHQAALSATRDDARFTVEVAARHESSHDGHIPVHHFSSAIDCESRVSIVRVDALLKLLVEIFDEPDQGSRGTIPSARERDADVFASSGVAEHYGRPMTSNGTDGNGRALQWAYPIV